MTLKRKNARNDVSGDGGDLVDGSGSSLWPHKDSSAAFVRTTGSSSWKDVQQQMNHLLSVGISPSSSPPSSSSAAMMNNRVGGAGLEANNDNTQKDENDDGCRDDLLLVHLQQEILPLHDQLEEWFAKESNLGQRIQSQLTEQLETAQHRSALRAQKLQEHQAQQAQLAQEWSQTAKALEATETVIARTQDAVARHQHNTSQHLQDCQDQENARKRQEDKFRQRLAFYKQCTGIQWNYDPDPGHMLEAHVTVPSLQEIRRVSIDPSVMSRFDIANKLWETMEERE